MKRRAIPSVLILSVVLGSQLSAQNKPSFSGAWDVRSPGESDPARLVISQTDASITITASGGLGGIVLGTRTFRLDSGETRWVTRDAQGQSVNHVARVEWIGDALAITTTTTPTGNGPYQTFEAFSLDHEHRLVMMRIDTPLYRGFMNTTRTVYTAQ